VPDTVAQGVEHFVDHSHDGEPSQKAADDNAMHNWHVANPDASSVDEASERLSMNYRGADVPANADTDLGDLSTVNGRTTALEQLTQQRADGDPVGNVDCGATAMVGGALLAQGDTGLTKLADDIEKKRLSGHSGWVESAQDALSMEVIKAKIANNEKLSVGDMQTMDESLYHAVKLDEQGVSWDEMNKEVQSGDPDAGLRLKDMHNFMNENPDLVDMYKQNHLDIAFISADDRRTKDGTMAPNHYVLEAKDSQKHNGMAGIYDPQHRRDGQVINDDDTEDDYLYARMAEVKPGEH
jgi:hypothetical protein